MEFIADLHIHSRFSRATSKNISLDNLEKYAKIKGINLLGTGDFQHPLWNKELKANLKEDDKGILWSKTGFPFVWQTEISLMFSQSKRRAVHIVILAPNGATADKITSYLGSKGRLDYDGRPIFGLTGKQLVKELKEIDDKIEIIPAHCLLPNEKIMCNSDIKKISDVEIGDKVLTHKGAYKKVTNTFIRHYKGKVYNIQPYYFREGVNVTAEHPFLAIKTVKNCSAIGGLCKPNSTAKGKHICKEKHYEKYLPMWVASNRLEVNDVLLYPRQKETIDLQEIKISDILNKDDFAIKECKIYPRSGRQDKVINNIIKLDNNLCRLIGYYLAEGYIAKKNNCIQFSFGKHESIYIKEVINLMKICFGVELAKKRERNGYELYFYSKILVSLFEKLFYELNTKLRAYSKRLPSWFIYLPIEKQVEIFRGWWRGDSGVTVSEILAQQMKLICLRLGIVPSVYKKTKEEHNKDERFIGKRRILASHDAFILQNLSFYEDKLNLLKEKEFIRFNTKLNRKHGWIDNNYIYIPIKEIKISNYKGNVYNLEVEEDNSYVTTSVTVHNCMTPWFGLYGSDSGFDSLQDCFGELTEKIYAIESGMSASPDMLWRFKEKVNIISFSDSHSMWPWRLGREAVIFDLDELSYDNIIKAIRTGKGLKATIETPPEYGKYHYDGHRNCNFSCSPEETKKLNGICPKCNKPLIIGVDYRVEEIAKSGKDFKPENYKPFYKLVPLHELIAFHLGTSMLAGKRVWEIYDNLIRHFNNEFNILLKVSREELEKAIPEHKELIELILLNREAKLDVKPGYDGTYGKIIYQGKESKFGEDDPIKKDDDKEKAVQKKLF